MPRPPAGPGLGRRGAASAARADSGAMTWRTPAGVAKRERRLARERRDAAVLASVEARASRRARIAPASGARASVCSGGQRARVAAAASERGGASEPRARVAPASVAAQASGARTSACSGS
jgi:hypothetical protein